MTPVAGSRTVIRRTSSSEREPSAIRLWNPPWGRHRRRARICGPRRWRTAPPSGVSVGDLVGVGGRGRADVAVHALDQKALPDGSFRRGQDHRWIPKISARLIRTKPTTVRARRWVRTLRGPATKICDVADVMLIPVMSAGSLTAGSAEGQEGLKCSRMRHWTDPRSVRRPIRPLDSHRASGSRAAEVVALTPGEPRARG